MIGLLCFVLAVLASQFKSNILRLACTSERLSPDVLRGAGHGKSTVRN
jgi:hypothetical protein